MKITGLLAEKGVQALHDVRTNNAPEGALRVWVVIAQDAGLEIWSRGHDGFETVAAVVSDGKVEAFSDEFSAWLMGARDQDAFDRIILLASPEILRIFRDSMPTDILACIAAEIPRDFSSLSRKDRKDALEKMIYI